MEACHPADRAPIEELANRAATSGGGLHAAAFAVGLEDHRRLLADHARRLKDSHSAMMQSAGFGKEAGDSVEGDDMGNIIVTGDIHVGEGSRTKLPWESDSQTPSQPITPTQPASPTQPSSLARNAALAAALFGAGAVPGALTAYMLTRPNEQQPAVYNGKDFELGLGEPGKPILPLNNEGTP